MAVRSLAMMSMPRTLRRRLLSVTSLGGPELIAALTLGAIVTSAHLDRHSPGHFLLLDVTTCAAAGLSGKFPRFGSGTVLVLLAVYLTLPTSWVTVGEIAFLIPVVGLIRLPHERGRLAYTIIGLVLLCTEAVLESHMHAIPSMVLWIGLTCLAWAGGTAIKKIGARHTAATEAALAEQRTEIARDLHDTLSHQLTQLAWRTELIRDRGYANPDELNAIAAAAHRSAGDIRTLIAMDAAAPQRSHLDPPAWSETLSTLQHRLVTSGFTVNIFSESDPPLTKATLTVIAKITTEITNNIERHAQPCSAVSVIVTCEEHFCEMVFVNDIGEGGARTKPSHDGLGVAGMRARAHGVGGSLEAGEVSGRWMTHLSIPTHEGGHR